MKSLKILLRRSMTIAFLSIPVEAFAGDDRRIALAFDGGPLPGATEGLLEELEKLDIKATFFPASFPASREMEAIPAQANALVEPAQVPASHASARNNLLEMGTPAARQEIAGSARILRELGYRDSLAFRPPFGLQPQELEQGLQEDGTAAARWQLLPESNAGIEDPQVVADYVADNAFPGAIVLMQPTYSQREQILRALPLISTKLRAKGYRFATLSELFADNSKEPAVFDL